MIGSDVLDVSGAMWLQMLLDNLLPTATILNMHSLQRGKAFPEADHTLCMLLKYLTKAILQYLPMLREEPEFPELWGRLLQILQVRAIAPCL